MTILGINFDYKRVVMYKHGASKSKKNKNAKIAKASELLAQEYGVDVV